MKITNIDLVDNKYIVSGWHDNALYKRQFCLFEELVDFLHSIGYYISDITYNFPNQPKEFSENVAICGGIQSPPDEKIVFDIDIDIDIEKVMENIKPIYHKGDE